MRSAATPSRRRRGIPVDVPTVGRLNELAGAHQAQGARLPTPRQDKIGADERSLSSTPTRVSVRPERYVSVEPTRADLPWATGLLVPFELEKPGRVLERDRVAWAVAAHRALVKLLDRQAPPLLTGVYPEGCVGRLIGSPCTWSPATSHW